MADKVVTLTGTCCCNSCTGVKVPVTAAVDLWGRRRTGTASMVGYNEFLANTGTAADIFYLKKEYGGLSTIQDYSSTNCTGSSVTNDFTFEGKCEYDPVTRALTTDSKYRKDGTELNNGCTMESSSMVRPARVISTSVTAKISAAYSDTGGCAANGSKSERSLGDALTCNISIPDTEENAINKLIELRKIATATSAGFGGWTKVVNAIDITCLASDCVLADYYRREIQLGTKETKKTGTQPDFQYSEAQYGVESTVTIPTADPQPTAVFSCVDVYARNYAGFADVSNPYVKVESICLQGVVGSATTVSGGQRYTFKTGGRIDPNVQTSTAGRFKALRGVQTFVTNARMVYITGSATDCNCTTVNPCV